MFGVALLTITLLALTDSRIYDSCELARDFLKLGVSKEHIATWVCIAYHESRFDTAARNSNSGDHGLLQISELYWCGPGKACDVSCSAFRDDDISDDVECALQIHEEHTRLQGDGFLAWVVYPHYCKHNAKKYLANCDVSLKDTSYKLEDRGRYLKSQNHGRNHLEPSPIYKTYPNIDELQPPTIPINTLLRGIYEANQANQDKIKYTSFIKEKDARDFVIQNNNMPKNPQFDWLNTISSLSNKATSNVKINNIDDLKPPVFGTVVLTTPSTTTTIRTTTVDPNLIGIKPPNPRRLETYQFRRRMMSFKNNYLENSNVKNNNFTKTKLPANSTITYNRLLHTSYLGKVTTLPKYDDRRTGPKVQPNIVSSFKIIHTDNKKEANSNQLTPTPFTRLPFKGILPTNGIFVTAKEMFVSTTTENIIQVKNQIKKVNVSTSMQRNNRTSLGHTNLVQPSSTEKYRSTTMLTTTEFNRRRFYFTPPQVETTTQYSRTVKPWLSRSTYITSRLSQSDNSTLRPKTSSPELKSTATLSSTSVSTERTIRPTQSIFDLYLNPTKRPNIAFRFPEFQKSPYKVRIFSGGTTPSPTFLKF